MKLCVITLKESNIKTRNFFTPHPVKPQITQGQQSKSYRMKKVILFFAIVNFLKPLHAQNSLETLEDAYVYFDAGKHKKAIKAFEKYFESTEGSKDDYYFMAASLASTGKITEALQYSEKACVGIETLGMMLADYHFKSIHDQLEHQFEQLKNFYEFYNNSRYYNREEALRKIDSLYQTLELKRVVGYDLYKISERFSYAKDTVKTLYYYKEAIVNGNMNPMYSSRIFKNLDAYKDKYPKYFDEYLPFVENIRKWTFGYRNFLYSGKHDSLTFALENLFDETPDIFATPELLYNAACGFSLTGNYEKAGSYLIKALDAGFNDIEHLFQDEDLFPLFNSPQGQKTLKYIISKYYGPSFIDADFTFVCTSREYTKSKRLIYDYIKSKNFDAHVPRAFEIFRNETQTVNMPLFWEDSDIQKTKFEFVFMIDNNNLIKVKTPSNNEKRIILCKKTKNTFYADNAGSCYNYPSENEAFINAVRQNKIELSKIPGIQTKYLSPLKKNAFAARLLTDIDSDDETFIFAIENGVEYIEPSMLTLLKETPPIELKPTLKYIDYSLDHTAFFDIVLEILKDTAYYNTLSEKEKHNFENIVSDLYEILPFRQLVGDDKDLRPEYDYQWSREKNYFPKLISTISKWWEDYKVENPFKLPTFIYNDQPNTVQLDDSRGYFFIDGKTQEPVFYDPFYKKIQIDGSTHDLSSNTFLKVGKIEDKAYIFTPSHHTNPDELLILSETNADDLENLKLIAKRLNLKAAERVKTERGGFNILYDRFYVAQAFDDLVYIWHNNDSILINSLSNTTDFNIKKNILVAAKQKVCFDDTTKYIETPYCLNSLKTKEIGDNLYVLCNSSISKKPYCKKDYYQNTYLQKINSDLQVEKEIEIPQIYMEGYAPTSNPDVELQVVGNKLYAFVWPSCCGPQKGYYQVFDLDLNPISELIEISANVGQQAMAMPSVATAVIDENVYLIYPTIESEEEFLKIDVLTPRKEDNKEFYLFEPRGVILQDALIVDKNNVLKYYYTEKFNNEYFINDISIDVKTLE